MTSAAPLRQQQNLCNLCNLCEKKQPKANFCDFCDFRVTRKRCDPQSGDVPRP